MDIPILDKIPQIISNFGNFAIKLGLAISVIALMYAGYKYFLTSGETKKTNVGLLFIIIGILVISLVFEIPKLLTEILH